MTEKYDWLFGWCGAGNGDYTGIGEYFSRVADDNKARTVYSVDLAGIVYEAQQRYNSRDRLGFRMTSKEGENLDRLPVDSSTGRYIGNPEEIAEHRHERIKHYWPSELDRGKVWSTYINEPSKEIGDVEYLARFALKSAELCLRDGFRYCAWGWSGGTPEREFWEHPLVLQYLRLCQEYPDQIGVNIHLYSELPMDLFFEYAYRVDRWQMLYDVCRKNNITPPFVFVAEFGWSENRMELGNQAAINQLSIVQDDMELGHFRGGCAIWTLGTWHGSIVNDMLNLVTPNTNTAVNYVGREIEEMPPMPEETLHEHLQNAAKQAQTVSYNRDAALQKAGNRNGYGITGSEARTEYEGIKYAVQPFGSLTADAERYYYSIVDDWGNVKSGDLRGDDIPPPVLIEPPMVFRPSDTQRITQKFGNNPAGYPVWNGCGHGGIDIGVAMGRTFYATRDGNVIHASDRRWSSNTPSGYGYHVVIDHGDCRTLYAHARQDLPVKVGDSVAAGTVVGYSGNTGNSEGYHLHYSILVNEQTGCHPQTSMGWFIDPEYVMSLPKPSEPPPTGQALDITPYFKPAGTHGIYTVFHFNDGRTQPQQAENLPDGRTILWKGEGQWFDGNPKKYYDYEEITVDDDGVKKGTDTSDSRLSGKMAYNLNWVTWLPKICHVGTVYPSSPGIREFDRTNCQTINNTTTTDYIYFREIIPLWVSPYNSEIRFTNVPVFEWRKTSDISTPAIEVYKFAVNVFYCECNNGAVGELPQGRQPLTGELTNC